MTRPVRVLAFGALVAGGALLAGLAQLLTDGVRAGSGDVLALTAGGAVLVAFPAFLALGAAVAGLTWAAERARAPLTAVRVGAAAAAGGLAYGMLAGGLWWVLNAYSWPTVVALSAVGAGWLLAGGPAARPAA